jgi:uncharacterized protein
MEIVSGIEIVDLCLYVKEFRTLIVSDTHIGYEEALNKKGILVPRMQFKDTLERFELIFSLLKKKKYVVDQIVINGDLKHEFGRISETEWRHTLKLLDYFAGFTKNIVLVKGNHDTFLKPIAEKRPFVSFVDHVRLGGILVLHGDVVKEKLIDKTVDVIIIGHEHCAISITSWPRTEKFKCFLLGKFKRKKLIAMPSFNLVVEGTDVLKEKLLSPFLKKVLDFNAFVVSDEEVLDFGKLKKLR